MTSYHDKQIIKWKFKSDPKRFGRLSS